MYRCTTLVYSFIILSIRGSTFVNSTRAVSRHDWSQPLYLVGLIVSRFSGSADCATYCVSILVGWDVKRGIHFSCLWRGPSGGVLQPGSFSRGGHRLLASRYLLVGLIVHRFSGSAGCATYCVSMLAGRTVERGIHFSWFWRGPSGGVLQPGRADWARCSRLNK